MPQQNLPVVRYNSESAAALADLISVRVDLVQTEKICERLVQALKAEDRDGVLIEALWTATLVRYARCFTTGKRVPLDSALLSHLPGDPIGAHSYYKSQRDKLIAHSVNPFEEAQIGLVLSNPAEPQRQVIGVAEFFSRLISSDEQGVRQLGALARELLRRVEEQIARRKTTVLEEARREPLDDLYALKPMAYTAPGPQMAGTARR